jgi:hypothetical protein
MKKFKYVIALLAMVVLFCIAGGSKAKATYQDETAQIKENKTDLSKWFDKEFQDKLLTLAFSASGAVIGVGMVVKSFKKGLKILNITNKKAEDNSKSIEDTKSEMKKDNQETQNIIKENNSATQKAIMEDNKKTLDAIEKRNKEMQELINKQSQALILLSKDERWVKNGTSEKIANLLGSDTNGKAN